MKLAEEGFVTFAPQNPYIGKDNFRQIQRKGHPLQLSLFSFIIGQHQRILWVSPGAWRFLGWRIHDKAAGRIRILPAEWNGPLPS